MRSARARFDPSVLITLLIIVNNTARAHPPAPRQSAQHAPRRLQQHEPRHQREGRRALSANRLQPVQSRTGPTSRTIREQIHGARP